MEGHKKVSNATQDNKGQNTGDGHQPYKSKPKKTGGKNQTNKRQEWQQEGANKNVIDERVMIKVTDKQKKQEARAEQSPTTN